MMEDTYYQLEEALGTGISNPWRIPSLKELKEHYEEVTGGLQLSIRELTSQLEIALQNHLRWDFEESWERGLFGLSSKLGGVWSLSAILLSSIDWLERRESWMIYPLIPVIFFSSRREFPFMETLSYCQWTSSLIGFVSFLIFVEVYGIYLFFTETRTLHGRFSSNGLFGLAALYHL